MGDSQRLPHLGDNRNPNVPKFSQFAPGDSCESMTSPSNCVAVRTLG